MVNEFVELLKKAATAVVNLFSATADILIANPTFLIITLFVGLTAGKSLQIGKIFKAKG